MLLREAISRHLHGEVYERAGEKAEAAKNEQGY
jgi:hypothetical protein